ncbi:intermembrane transport protein PqiB [Neisseria dumasiana]|uniref:Paraquat-inducible protein B n=1 Tax=Neisseria dumasiana TaxID=1931275 RepID=A0ABX3WLM9_9NEIS|nr:intermembrane transport protein PqiB [Neisseria dumasiana]OSI35242.1 paraquat-inducible protein B [Neisseria dumasiana]UOO85374.1 intermembrane transport protein PqiB [Neisseria dumasiana]
MNNHHQNEYKPVPAVVRKTNVFTSVIWLIPLIAFLVGGWLLMKEIRNRGPEVTLLMDSADGIEVNNTVVKVLSVEVGRVTRIGLQHDRKGVEVTVRLTADAKDMMRKDTQFWVVKPRIDESGISGLTTLVSGSYIAFTPGKSEETQYRFEVSDIPPITAIGQHGLRLKLVGKNDKMISVGSPVLYEDFSVGVVESASFDPNEQTVNYTIFITSPNDKLVGKNSQFWLQSGINIEATGGGVRIESAPIPALLSGAIAFSRPVSGEKGLPPANGDTFTVYSNRSEVDNLPGERALYYTAFFKQSVRGLSSGSPVEYKGINIGAVADVPYFAPNDSLKLFDNGWIPVRIRIEPDRLEINADAQSKEYWRNRFQTALNKGLTATLSSDNLLTGSKMIELDDSPSNGPKLKPVADYNGNIVIASRNGGLDNLQDQLGNLLEKFNKLPLDKTVGELNGSLRELRATLNSANALLGKPQTQNIPNELNKTLHELRQTLKGISPQSPLYSDVQTTLQSIDKTLKDAQPVINTLKEKPNSLIFNSNVKDPIPKGSR